MGIIYLVEITNMAEFCRIHGYSKANMHKLATGKYNVAYGWTKPDKDDL